MAVFGEQQMRKVLLVGKFNILFEEISAYLSRFFNVQICESGLMLESNLLRVSNPDIVLIDLLGMEDEKEAIFYELRTYFRELPLVCLKASQDDVLPEMVEGIDKYKILKLPAGNERITEVVCELLGARYDRESGTIVDSAYTRKCVLAIDDNSIQLRMLNEILKDEYDIMLANSAVKALTMLGKRIPDIILLDYDMPMCDGRMTLQMIREIDEAKDVPVVFLTGVKDATHIKAVLALHPAGYLLKPAKSSVLRKEIEKHIGLPR